MRNGDVSTVLTVRPSLGYTLGPQVDPLNRRVYEDSRSCWVVVASRESKRHWSAFRVGSATFGSCTITQRFENSRGVWKGEMKAHLVHGNEEPSKIDPYDCATDNGKLLED